MYWEVLGSHPGVHGRTEPFTSCPGMKKRQRNRTKTCWGPSVPSKAMPAVTESPPRRPQLSGFHDIPMASSWGPRFNCSTCLALKRLYQYTPWVLEQYRALGSGLATMETSLSCGHGQGRGCGLQTLCGVISDLNAQFLNATWRPVIILQLPERWAKRER